MLLIMDIQKFHLQHIFFIILPSEHYKNFSNSAHSKTESKDSKRMERKQKKIVEGESNL